MGNSLLSSGGSVQVPNTVTANAPAVLYDSDGTHGANADYGAIEQYNITNLDSNWLYVQIPQMHKAGQGTLVPPGVSMTFGFRSNFIKAVLAWATAPAVGGAAATCNIGGGFQLKA